MVKCVSFFLFATIFLACSGDGGSRNNGRNNGENNTRFIQIGDSSVFEWGQSRYLADTLAQSVIFDGKQKREFSRISPDLWIFEAGDVGVWRIDGDIPDEIMFLQENSVAVLGKNANLAKVAALGFSSFIVLEGFSHSNLLLMMDIFDEKIKLAQENREIIFLTDGVFWY